MSYSRKRAILGSGIRRTDIWGKVAQPIYRLLKNHYSLEAIIGWALRHLVESTFDRRDILPNGCLVE